MTAVSDIDDLVAVLRETVQDAYLRGFQDGQEETRQAIIAAATGNAIVASFRARQQADQKAEDEARRAPRGLIDSALEAVIQPGSVMAIQDVEEAVQAYDARVATKSVYNRLRWYEKQGLKFQRIEGRWGRRADVPNWSAQSSPQGETGGVAPPASNQPSSGSAEPVTSGSKGAWGT